MAHFSSDIDAFKECTGPYPYRNFVWLISQLGYEEVKAGKTSGARRKFFNKETKLLIVLHEPHDGEMGRGMVRRLQKDLEDKGVI